eukprot:TRINITY_DN39532_c0_g1_i1.p1 TRINITY_DN39532_c0_g1~~TRINITY_DN39532_c0_g1_i1.p1  ORF type:complete len:180 (-),score=15.66 TRINITY_DN39532_c0_g1_i1:27-566(-)
MGRFFPDGGHIPNQSLEGKRISFPCRRSFPHKLVLAFQLVFSIAAVTKLRTLTACRKGRCFVVPQRIALRVPTHRTDLLAAKAESSDPSEWGGAPPGKRLPKGFETWSDYTRFALKEVKVMGPIAPGPDETKAPSGRPSQLVDRKRALGIDFGPSFTGMALSLGGVNTMPMGTLKTGTD